MTITLPKIGRPGRAQALSFAAALALSFSVTAGATSSLTTGNAALVVAQAASEVPINPNHPETYVVQKGDTLWDISAKFLTKPWFWPEIWYVNPQVGNPHLIYPGDVLKLVWIDGRPQLVRDGPRIREESLDGAVPTIPLDTIKPFLTRGGILTDEQIRNLPYIMAIRDDHLTASAGQDVYVRGTGVPMAEGAGYNIVQVGDQLRDPDDGAILGYEGIYVGDGTVRVSGDPSTVRITRSKQEANEGDLLIQQELDVPLNFYPRGPDDEITGQIIDVYQGVSRIGQFNVVTLNRGARHGLEQGHVLDIWQKGDVVRDRYATGANAGKVTLPDEYAGILMVFQVYDRVSYALVLEAENEIRVLDRVTNPQ